MSERILITGGAGFIGSHLADAYLQQGYEVRVLDNLDPQVHGSDKEWPSYLNDDVEKILGDVRNRDDLEAAIEGVDYISHHAAAVGVGQSMYEIDHYVANNSHATATLLDVLAKGKNKVAKLIVASSMSVYGEGAYLCYEHGPAHPSLRTFEQLSQRQWEHACPKCGLALRPTSTPETKPCLPTSVYALTKYDQEQLCLYFGREYKVPVVALRYFNIYGPRQALSNPYTGVAAIFSSRLLSHKPPVVFEDGEQSRDFIHIKDIAEANLTVLKDSSADGEVFNVCTGQPITVTDLAEMISNQMGSGIAPEKIHKYRAGDIRHCYGDDSKLKRLTGFSTRIRLEDGIKDLVAWVASQQAEDNFDKVKGIMEDKGLVW